MRTVHRRSGTTDSIASTTSRAMPFVVIGPRVSPLDEGVLVMTKRGHSSSVVSRT